MVTLERIANARIYIADLIVESPADEGLTALYDRLTREYERAEKQCGIMQAARKSPDNATYRRKGRRSPRA